MVDSLLICLGEWTIRPAKKKILPDHGLEFFDSSESDDSGLEDIMDSDGAAVGPVTEHMLNFIINFWLGPWPNQLLLWTLSVHPYVFNVPGRAQWDGNSSVMTLANLAPS